MRFYVIYIILFAPLTSTSCLPEYTEFNSKCYFFSYNPSKFAAAELTCREKGGHLISIHDSLTNAYIAQNATSDLWIGLTNLKDSSAWKWTDNSALNYTKWNNETHLKTSNKSCAFYSITDENWYSEDCYVTKPFLCQFLEQPICEDGFFYFPPTKSCLGGRGFAYNWSQAENYCDTNHNAHLSVIESFAEFQLAATYMSAVFEGYWMGIQFSNESQTWVTVNGNEPDFVNWCPGHPQDKTDGICANIAYSPPYFCFEELNCSNVYKIHYLCKKEANIDFKYRNCPPSLMEWNSKCFSISQNNSDFAEAELSCTEIGGNLASIHDGFENAILSQFYNGAASDVWIGLSNLLEPPQWKWVDNSLLNYQNWEEKEFSNISEMKCGSASLIDGKWKAEECYQTKQFICEIEYQVPNCSEGWFYLSATESCYGNHKAQGNQNRRSYRAAHDTCISDKANLPSIHTFVYSTWYGYWLGICTFDGGKTWKTEDGSAADFLSYGEWCAGSPLEGWDEQCVGVQPFNDGRGCYEAANCTNGNSKGLFSICQKHESFISLSQTTTTVLSSEFSTSKVFVTTEMSETTNTIPVYLSTATEFTSTKIPFGKHENTSKLLWYIGGSTISVFAFIIIITVFIYRLKQRNRQKKLNELFYGLIKGSASGQLMNEYTEHHSVKMEMDELEIDFVHVLGKGSNARVHQAQFKQKNTDGKKVEVAVKIPIRFEEDDINLFKLELDAFVTIGSHPHIITFYGWILYQNVPAIVLELATENLLLYVGSFRKKSISTSNFISILLQISQALKHVASLNIIHRDVACRNILMINNDYVKLADFGLCCKCNETETYYASSRKKLPLKWLSIEALTQRKFSEKSDVWAFGILCYEMFSCGNEPYSTLTNDELLEFLQSGKRLSIPKGTPESVALIMDKCWNENPDDRPTFAILEESLKEILKEETVKYGYITINAN